MTVVLQLRVSTGISNNGTIIINNGSTDIVIKIITYRDSSNDSPIITYTYTVDTTAPSAPAGLNLANSSDSGIANNDNITNIFSDLTIDGTGEDGSTLQLYENNALLEGASTTLSGVNWEFTNIDLTFDGPHVITAKQTDAAGNTSPASSGLNITIDTTNPYIDIAHCNGDDFQNTNDIFTLVFSEDVWENHFTTPAIPTEAELDLIFYFWAEGDVISDTNMTITTGEFKNTTDLSSVPDNIWNITLREGDDGGTNLVFSEDNKLKEKFRIDVNPAATDTFFDKAGNQLTSAPEGKVIILK